MTAAFVQKAVEFKNPCKQLSWSESKRDEHTAKTPQFYRYVAPVSS